MSYTKKFFKFPIKLYDAYDMINATNEETENMDKLGKLIPVNSDSVVGTKTCRIDSIVGWNESYGKEQSLDDVREHGFPNTLVSIKEGDGVCDFECVLTMKQFEALLNKFAQENGLI